MFEMRYCYTSDNPLLLLELQNSQHLFNRAGPRKPLHAFASRPTHAQAPPNTRLLQCPKVAQLLSEDLYLQRTHNAAMQKAKHLAKKVMGKGSSHDDARRPSLSSSSSSSNFSEAQAVTDVGVPQHTAVKPAPLR